MLDTVINVKLDPKKRWLGKGEEAGSGESGCARNTNILKTEYNTNSSDKHFANILDSCLLHVFTNVLVRVHASLDLK